jgi:hypothetical protein
MYPAAPADFGLRGFLCENRVMNVDGRGGMRIKGSLSKVGEFGIGMAAVAMLALGGCGGGGSSGGSSNSGNGSGTVAANQFLADTHANWSANQAGAAVVGTPSVVASAGITSFVATGANSYTINRSEMELATTTSAWSPTAASSSAWYYLSATGWQPYDYTTAGYTNNGNGTISYTALGGLLRSNISAITRTDLSGKPVACTDPKGDYTVGENIGTDSSPLIVTAASCPVAGTYPAGSVSYTVTYNLTWAEHYSLLDDSTLYTLTDETGAALTALPNIGTRFCFAPYVYDPIPGAAAGTDNYNRYPSGPCTGANIATALLRGSQSTALVSLKVTGNAVVPNMFDIRSSDGTTTYDSMYAFHLGKLLRGWYDPATTSTSTTTSFNKTAANAQLRANGLPLLP